MPRKKQPPVLVAIRRPGTKKAELIEFKNRKNAREFTKEAEKHGFEWLWTR